MVGIVLVSHSEALAEATRALAAQQTQGRSALAAVGGTGNPEQPFGTDAMAILEAIQQVDEGDGVVVIMDLGSAVMSAETALEFLDPQQAARVRLSAGPFVEGAMAAAVQASIGMGLEAVLREAAGAMTPKQEALGAGGGDQRSEVRDQRSEVRDQRSEVEEQGWGEHVARVTLVNHAGLHFGPAVLFVQKAAEQQAELQVRNLSTGAGPVDATRFNQVLSLGAEQGHEIEIAGRGPQAEAAVAALAALVQAGFGEVARPPEELTLGLSEGVTPAAAPLAGAGAARLQGIPASPGYAVGPAVMLEALARRVSQAAAADPAAEWQRYEQAAAQATAELHDLAERLQRELGAEQARIFQAHAMLLGDPDLTADMRRQVWEQRQNAEAALVDVTEAAALRLEGMEGQRFQQRAADLRDVQQRLLRILRGESEQELALPQAAIILASDLSPSQTAQLDRERVAALCTALGGPTAHAAILARSMGIPAVVGVGEALFAQVKAGDLLAVDGAGGVILLQPDAETQAAFRAGQEALLAQRLALQAGARQPAYTGDGRRVEVVANLAAAIEAQAALEAGAEGVGLLRTEFLFQERVEPPGEEEQVAVYEQVAEIMAPRPVIVRTLDVGGDKPAPYLDLPAEDNPFLGWRAIRISLDMPEFFKTQLRAILRAARHGNVQVMFPMVTTVAEVQQARALLATAAAELAAAGTPHAATLPTGIMIEAPAAVEIAGQLAPLVDFFSIGTNDLTQYTFAVDRTNARVAALADPLHPAILRQIARVIACAHEHGRWAGVCGELAGEPAAIPILLGLGLDEFSMAAVNIPAAKALLARLTVPATEALARQVLELPDGQAVRAAVAAFLETLAQPVGEK